MAFGYNFTVTLLEEGKVILSKPIVINQGDKNCKINLEFKAENVLQDLTDKTFKLVMADDKGVNVFEQDNTTFDLTNIEQGKASVKIVDAIDKPAKYTCRIRVLDATEDTVFSLPVFNIEIVDDPTIEG